MFFFFYDWQEFLLAKHSYSFALRWRLCYFLYWDTIRLLRCTNHYISGTFIRVTWSRGCVTAPPSATVFSLPRNTRFFLLCWHADLLSLHLKPRAIHIHQQSMSRIIGWDLSCQLTHRHPTDSPPQAVEIASHSIIASSFLENSISFMSVAFDGCYFVATFHCNFSYGYLLYVVTLINAS